ncbi:MAG: hypothetical protein NAG76_22380 [Candidatus Pristimantibacillus lignocellulolyticus]|uniref:Uncharacterized protein n=1 Tax=Candidatus Pristimantibacillus lignocellulolyticus TaxID=2994561 RepID=A0A9J6ZEF1_9BACL|nr:MAG: hypothetical protein NAG76_22380 [Candidatus Pristimantibacillus lignocellulolyticus]
MLFAQLLHEKGLTSGPVYATGILKGHEAARMVADFFAQETIHAEHDRILTQYGGEAMRISDERLEVLGNYFDQTNVRETIGMSFEQFLNLHERGRWHERVV